MNRMLELADMKDAIITMFKDLKGKKSRKMETIYLCMCVLKSTISEMRNSLDRLNRDWR